MRKQRRRSAAQLLTVQLISAFVFAIRKVQSHYYLNPKFQASGRLLWLCSPVCVGPGRKPRRPVFSQRGSYSKPAGSFTCLRSGRIYVTLELFLTLIMTNPIIKHMRQTKSPTSQVRICAAHPLDNNGPTLAKTAIRLSGCSC